MRRKLVRTAAIVVAARAVPVGGAATAGVSSPDEAHWFAMFRTIKRSTRRLRSLAAVTGAAALLAVTGAAPAHASGGPHLRLINWNSGQCLAVGGASTAGGAGVIQWPCTSGAEQKWYEDGWKTVNGNIYFELVNVNSGKCLADPADNPNEGVQLIQYGCDGGEEQYWSNGAGGTPPSGYLTGMFSLAHPSLYVAVGGASTTPGAPVIQWPFDGDYEQAWQVIYPVG